MTWILLGACVVVCPLMMGVMMLGMRRGTPRRKRKPNGEGDQHRNE